MKEVVCDLCNRPAGETDGPPETMDTKRRAYGRLMVTVRRRFWDGAPFGFVTKKLDICARCEDRIIRGIGEDEL